MLYTIQNNRNPYTDHPEYVQAIGIQLLDAQALQLPQNLRHPQTTTQFRG
jgi:hypothetical protein